MIATPYQKGKLKMKISYQAIAAALATIMLVACSGTETVPAVAPTPTAPPGATMYAQPNPLTAAVGRASAVSVLRADGGLQLDANLRETDTCVGIAHVTLPVLTTPAYSANVAVAAIAAGTCVITLNEHGASTSIVVQTVPPQ